MIVGNKCFLLFDFKWQGVLFKEEIIENTLFKNESVQIKDVPDGAAITLVDELEYTSHTEFFHFPETTIIFDWF